MELKSTYRVKIKHYNHIFKDTVCIYRSAVDFLIEVCISDWDSIECNPYAKARQRYVERLIHRTKDNPKPCYDFDSMCEFTSGKIYNCDLNATYNIG